MSIDIVLATVGILGMLVATISARMRRLPLSEPLIALVAGVLLGPAVMGVLPIEPLTSEQAFLHEASGVLLAISVMAVALRFPLSVVRERWRPVLLLVVLVMPLMAIASAAISWAVLDISIAAALLLGAAISPTDPVLASSVVTGEAAEQDLPARDRHLLSLESGANDGLALPLVLVALAIAGTSSVPSALVESLWQVMGGIVVGALAGGLGGAAMRMGDKHGATASAPALFFTVVLALGTLGISGITHVDGVLAVFVAGLAFNLVATGGERTSEAPIDEAINRFAVLPLFLVLGAALPWTEWGALGWNGLVLVVAILLLRRVPPLLVLARALRLPVADALYLGWFGPVGVAALFYLTLEAARGGASATILAAGSLVLVCSTVVFGLTGAPGRALYRKSTARAGASASRDKHGRAGTGSPGTGDQ
ncbi:cation:proton antiporter domain-containing protein [Lolliginicoccus levis]|uniref:cation:proton antiporter domain-containing protein n=1 Tax=Lolliginicoccus levis TaxID=2919542 RepID=UPI00241F7770|nr:cation:proton antiporter [Lolliginicoccus levis]